MIKLFNESLTSRYVTVERNIKSKSNSFYDSYLDLLEATIKFFLDENKISYDSSRTCGYLIKNEKHVKKFFIKAIKVDDHTYDKIPDYIKKCNDHKHKKEKSLSIDSVINYLKVYFDFVNYYKDYIKEDKIVFDDKYYSSIFGETERLNIQYRESVIGLKKELKDAYEANKLSEKDIEKYKSLLTSKDIELLNIEEQNDALQKQIMIMQDIKINSLEGKMHIIADNLYELGITIENNQLVNAALKHSSLTPGSYNHNDTIKDIDKTIARTKKIIDNSNNFINKKKEDILKLNEGIADVIDFINDLKKGE